MYFFCIKMYCFKELSPSHGLWAGHTEFFFLKNPDFFGQILQYSSTSLIDWKCKNSNANSSIQMSIKSAGYVHSKHWKQNIGATQRSKKAPFWMNSKILIGLAGCYREKDLSCELEVVFFGRLFIEKRFGFSWKPTPKKVLATADQLTNWPISNEYSKRPQRRSMSCIQYLRFILY